MSEEGGRGIRVAEDGGRPGSVSDGWSMEVAADVADRSGGIQSGADGEVEAGMTRESRAMVNEMDEGLK